jgi:DNA replication ATP-dependent helicase Dna2
LITEKQYELLEQSWELIPGLIESLHSGDEGVREKIRQLFYFLTDHLSRGEDLQFSTGFAVLSYIGTKYNLDGALLFRLHLFRKFLHRDDPSNGDENWKSGLFAIALLIANLLDRIPGPEIEALEVPLSHFKGDEEKGMEYIPQERVVFTGRKSEEGWEVLREKVGGRRAFIKTEQTVFDKDLTELHRLGFSNVTLLLKEIRADESGILHPAVIIVEPDFIMDVTAVASCVQPHGNFPAIHLLNKFLPHQNSKYLMAGHVANYFLDQLMENPGLSYTELIKNAFSIDPVAFCALPDEDIQHIARSGMVFYKNISRLIRTNFLADGRELNQFSIEPSFYSPGNGLQGRLDLLYRDRARKKSEIFELKSGSTFRPNSYGINPSHYAQTMLYYLILKDLYPRDENLSAYIIYAKDDKETLRFAPAVRAFQHQTLALRNQLYIKELKMQSAQKVGTEAFTKYSGIAELEDMAGFIGSNARDVAKNWKRLDETEKRYLLEFYAFISREFAHSKTASGGNPEARKGLSALWLDDIKSKEGRFALLSGLKIIKDLSGDPNPRLVFSPENSPQKLANFRTGDAVVLYAQGQRGKNAPFTRVYRGTLIEQNQEKLTVRLRSRLSKTEKPDENTIWAMEPDVLESGFRHYYRSLATFMRAAKEKRSLWLGKTKPGRPEKREAVHFEGLTEEQNRVMNKIINSEDYFLLWGPPGTGKTSVIIKNLINYLVEREDQRILLLAYTNRAVDEICDAIKSLGPEFVRDTTRIGSRYGTSPRHRELLLERGIAGLSDRKQTADFLQSKKIYVSTVSSFYGKWDIQKLVPFDTVIIDEASQILEPYLVGLLSCFDRSILIGDHCQLPAIVTQDTSRCELKHPELNKLGLQYLSDSLFERLYLLAKERGLDYACDSLSQQGRMHSDIAGFVSENFYGGGLDCLDQSIPGSERMRSDLVKYYPNGADQHTAGLFRSRILFANTAAEGSHLKTNLQEAEATLEFIEEYIALKGIEGEDQIGIICPYKAQIALISHLIEEKLPDYQSLITVDTVERYQGGARDVIILSLCTNHKSQLHTLVNENRHGLDRKLNVALTRAREQIVILGNAEILQQNATYSSLLDRADWIQIKNTSEAEMKNRVED